MPIKRLFNACDCWGRETLEHGKIDSRGRNYHEKARRTGNTVFFRRLEEFYSDDWQGAGQNWGKEK